MNQRREILHRYRLPCQAIDALRRNGYRRIGEEWMHPTRGNVCVVRVLTGKGQNDKGES